MQGLGDRVILAVQAVEVASDRRNRIGETSRKIMEQRLLFNWINVFSHQLPIDKGEEDTSPILPDSADSVPAVSNNARVGTEFTDQRIVFLSIQQCPMHLTHSLSFFPDEVRDQSVAILLCYRIPCCSQRIVAGNSAQILRRKKDIKLRRKVTREHSFRGSWEKAVDHRYIRFESGTTSFLLLVSVMLIIPSICHFFIDPPIVGMQIEIVTA